MKKAGHGPPFTFLAHASRLSQIAAAELADHMGLTAADG